MDNAPEIENHLREKRQALGLSQKQLADKANITRQAVCALETNQYSPATSVALQLARALRCRVEDLFSIKTGGEIIEGALIGTLAKGANKIRAQVSQIGTRVLVRPLIGLGDLATLATAADGLIVGRGARPQNVSVELFGDRAAVARNIVVAGCDPAMFLIAEHLRKKDADNLVPCLMGSTIAVEALKRGEVHVAGVHLADERSGRWNLPVLERTVKDMDCMVVTFAHWQEGLIVQEGNPKKIRRVSDLARPAIQIVNRENGSGARRLLDREIQAAGISSQRVRGYRDEVFSHLEVASRIRSGIADAGIGVQAAAAVCALDFVPLQRERYDLVIPRTYYDTLPGVRRFLDTMVSKRFRDELAGLGGYDTADIGKLVETN
jgi:molybdate-binding protein/DNA-binding XRE family transcriptional regulator